MSSTRPVTAHNIPFSGFRQKHFDHTYFATRMLTLTRGGLVLYDWIVRGWFLFVRVFFLYAQRLTLQRSASGFA